MVSIHTPPATSPHSEKRCVTERTDFEIGVVVTEFIADRDSQEHTGQTTGCRHGDADADTEMLRG